MSQSPTSGPERPYGNGGILTVVGLIVSFVLFGLGIYLFGWAPSVHGFEFVLFSAGIVAVALGVGIPIHVIAGLDGSKELDPKQPTGRRR